MNSGGFFAVAEHNPGREVLVDSSGASVAAGDLLAGMNRTARALRSIGLVAGDTIAVVLSNRREFIECYGAAIQSGMFFVAINWHLGPGEISYILEDSNAKVVVTESRFAEVAVGAAQRASIEPPRIFAVDDCQTIAALQELVRGESEETPADRAPGQIMFYTSGTTGRPKGVRKTFRAQASQELTLMTGVGTTRRGDESDDVVFLSSGPFYHALPIAGAVGALDGGAMVVVMDKWTPEAFLRLVEQYRVTDATVVPTMFHRLLALPDDVREAADVSSLRSVMHAGAPCPVDVKRRMIQWWGPIITEIYSSTEGAGTTVTSQEWLAKPGTVGRPSPGVEIKIFAPDGE